MADVSKLMARAESLVERLERLLPREAPATDWAASIAFRWRKKNSRGHIEPVRHVHRIALRDLQGIDAQK
ncbi:MAG: AAA family ATPase, partial [Burkholderiales bacterium]